MRKLCINSSEIGIILGKKPSTAQKLLRTIKDAYGKKKHQSVTIREFCDFECLPYEEIFNMLNGIDLASDKTSTK
ncbi:hypothetical protein [Bizionia arctica]|uniref:Uncharacterized protein n=1 Tax=Bizionia arctica TaxID=1495645 RepID=A0A917LRF2_9FLAO|nr:hypothetical protein [Bizionia arctica]GGG53112.1 hypothetical protein GCM10010976_25220 [Bizionia arctica]